MSVPHGVVAKSPSTIRENPKSHTYIDGGKDADMLASGIPCREAKQGCLASTYLDGTVIVLRREQNVLWLSKAKHTHVTSMKGGAANPMFRRIAYLEVAMHDAAVVAVGHSTHDVQHVRPATTFGVVTLYKDTTAQHVIAMSKVV